MSKLKNLVHATKNIGTNLNGVKQGAKILADKNSIFTKEVGKQMLGEAGKEVGKGLVLPGAALAGAGALGAGVKALSKKKEKTAFDVVNDSFDKIAGIKDIPGYFTGKAVKDATKAVDAAKESMKGMKLGDPRVKELWGKRQSAIKALDKAKKNTTAARVGAGVATAGATAYGAKKVMDNKKEKTAFDVINDSFDKIAKEKDINTKSLRKNVTGRAIGAGVMGGLAGAEAGGIMGMASPTMNDMKKKMVGGAAIGAGLNMANSIRKNVKHNRKIDAIDNKIKEKTAFDVVEESLEKIAEIFTDNKNNLHSWNSDIQDELYDRAYDMDVENSDDDNYYYYEDGPAYNAVNDSISQYINNHPNKQQALDDIAFNKSRLETKHKHSGKVRKAGAALGAIAPVAVGALAGAGLGALNRKAMTPKAKAPFVNPTLSKGQAAMRGAELGGSMGWAGGLGSTVGLLGGAKLGGRIADKMDNKAREKMGPVRLDNANLIESDLEKHFSNPETQEAIFNNVKYNNKTAGELVSDVFAKINS